MEKRIKDLFESDTVLTSNEIGRIFVLLYMLERCRNFLMSFKGRVKNHEDCREDIHVFPEYSNEISALKTLLLLVTPCLVKCIQEGDIKGANVLINVSGATVPEEGRMGFKQFNIGLTRLQLINFALKVSINIIGMLLYDSETLILLKEARLIFSLKTIPLTIISSFWKEKSSF